MNYLLQGGKKIFTQFLLLQITNKKIKIITQFPLLQITNTKNVNLLMKPSIAKPLSACEKKKENTFFLSNFFFQILPVVE